MLVAMLVLFAKMWSNRLLSAPSEDLSELSVFNASSTVIMVERALFY